MAPSTKPSGNLGKIFWDPHLLIHTRRKLEQMTSRLLLVPKMLMILILSQLPPFLFKVMGYNSKSTSLAQQLRPSLGCPHPISKCLGSNSSSTPDSRFLQMSTWEAAGESSSTCLPNTHVGDWDWIPGSWLLPRSTPAYCRHLRKWTSEWKMAIYLSIHLSIYPSVSSSVFQIN